MTVMAVIAGIAVMALMALAWVCHGGARRDPGNEHHGQEQDAVTKVARMKLHVFPLPQFRKSSSTKLDHRASAVDPLRRHRQPTVKNGLSCRVSGPGFTRLTSRTSSRYWPDGSVRCGSVIVCAGPPPWSVPRRATTG